MDTVYLAFQLSKTHQRRSSYQNSSIIAWIWSEAHSGMIYPQKAFSPIGKSDLKIAKQLSEKPVKAPMTSLIWYEITESTNGAPNEVMTEMLTPYSVFRLISVRLNLFRLRKNDAADTAGKYFVNNHN